MDQLENINFTMVSSRKDRVKLALDLHRPLEKKGNFLLLNTAV